MPQVPGLTPSVDPTSGGNPGVGIAVPTEAFGGAVGHALSGIGESIAGAGDKIWQRAVELQNLNNETEAKNADAKYMMDSAKMHADFGALTGEAAAKALPQHIQDLNDLRTQIRTGLSNPMSQKMYDSSSLSFMGRNVFNAAGHAAQQTKVAANGASQARVDQLSDYGFQNPDDQQGFDKAVNSIKAETYSQGKQNGWSEDQTEQTADANVSSAVAKRITGLARTDPFMAQTLFDNATKSGALQPNDASKVQATVQTQSRQAVSRGVSGKVNADLDHPAEEGVPQKSLEDRIAEAEADPDVQRFAKNDPFLQDFVKQRVITDYSRSKAIQRDADIRNTNTVDRALLTGDQQGYLPTTMDQLKAINPEVSQAVDALSPAKQLAFMEKLKRNASGNRIAETPDTLKTYQTIKGQSIDDPVSFLERDITKEKLPNSSMKSLIDLQFRLQQQSTTDPRVGRALQILSPDLHAAGINKKDNADGYYQFVGAMQDALDDFHNQNKKVPTADDVKTIGSRLMQEQVTDKGWLWDSKAPLYSVPVPDEDDKRIRQSPFWQQRGITTIRPDQVQRYYAAEQYNKLYGGSGRKPEAQ